MDTPNPELPHDDGGASARPADTPTRTTQDASDAAQMRPTAVGEMGREWAETLRATVREHPLASLAAAAAVGLLVGLIGRSDGH